MEFAVVDIETTGATSVGGKITEIAIVVTDGYKIIDRYETLVNPEQKIPYFITRLTGINDAMVRTAPKFYEVAKEVINYTKDRVFVAHNSSFDYGFFRKEFKDLGYDYQRKTICTVKTARKVFPGLNSYSLGKISKHFGIEIKARHRAMGDAEATAILFHKMIDKEPDFISDYSFNTILDDQLKVNKLPQSPGIYYLKDKEGEIIYIGKSKNIQSRVKTHLRNFKTKKGSSIIEEIAKIDYLKTVNEIMASLFENKEIKKYKPKYNHAQKNTVFPYGMYFSVEEGKYPKIDIKKAQQDILPLIGFKSLEQAKKKVERLSEKYQLCLAINGIEKYTSPRACFGYSIEKCKGACIDKEPVEVYSKRFDTFLKDYGITNQNHVFTCDGLTKKSQGFVLIQEGKLTAFGFCNGQKTNFKNVDQLLLLSEEFKTDKDYQYQIKNLFRDKQFKRIDL